MSLPPGFLDEIRARLPLSEVVGRRVAWDHRKSNQAKGDWWACCPFHEEKSPSFHVDDRKGFYHCFGCHASGDHVSFLRERENMGFMEAVEELARAAGLEMPARDPEAAVRAEKGRDLARWTEAAAQFFRAQLRGARGRAALDYLRARGLSEETLAAFEIGYAPPERRALFDHLAGKGAPEAEIVEAGLAARPEDGGAPYDRFRDRVIFPIRDARGRCVAFGGRAMSPDAKAKYLNSPETPLFDKSRTLYNHGPARAAAAKARALVVVEGYMDAIALAQAGVGHVVAPLGTAITEHHLRQIWRIADEPVIALDGDRAGREAALRAAELALPLLEAGKALRVALMPQGMDPDDLVRAEGRDAFDAALEAAEPLSTLLWRRETEGRAFDSPERRAALDKRLGEIVGRIADPRVRAHYREAFRELRRELFRPEAAGRSASPRPRGFRGGRPFPGPPMPRPETRASALALAEAESRGRETAILRALRDRPALLESRADAVAEAIFLNPDLDRIRAAFLSAVIDEAASLSARVARETGLDLDAALGGGAGRGPVGADGAEEAFDDLLDRHRTAMTARRERDEIVAALGEGADGPELARLRALCAFEETEGRGRHPEERETVRPVSERLDELLAARRGKKPR